MTIVKFFLFLFLPLNVLSYSNDLMPSDSRIRTYIYNPNEVYLLNLHYGFQTNIEFERGEDVESFILGETYAWNINHIGNRIFIKPLEKDVYTNMVIITNRRVYNFDLLSKELGQNSERTDLVYSVKFFYPKN